MVLSPQEEALNSGLKARVVEIKTEETTLLLRRTDDVDRSARRSTIALIGGSLLYLDSHHCVPPPQSRGGDAQTFRAKAESAIGFRICAAR